MLRTHYLSFYLSFVLMSYLCLSCTEPLTSKKQGRRDHVLNVHNQIKEITVDDVLIGNIARLYLIDQYLIIADYKSTDKLIHIFDKNTYVYVTSTAYQGEGPDEITNMGHIGVDDRDHIFFVSDHGKQKIFKYNLDSLLVVPSYTPTEKIKIEEEKFPDKYVYLNDTLSFALIIEPTGRSGYIQSVAKWDMNTGKITPMPYKHPNVNKKRVNIAVEPKIRKYVECYSSYDLMSIFDFNGKLIYNVYGPNWKNPDRSNHYYGKPLFCERHIVALYSGESSLVHDDIKGAKVNLPTQFLIFDLEGNYQQTIETGYQISDFCYDKDNERIIMNFDDNIQFGYLDVKKLFKNK